MPTHLPITAVLTLREDPLAFYAVLAAAGFCESVEVTVTAEGMHYLPGVEQAAKLAPPGTVKLLEKSAKPATPYTLVLGGSDVFGTLPGEPSLLDRFGALLKAWPSPQYGAAVLRHDLMDLHHAIHDAHPAKARLFATGQTKLEWPHTSLEVGETLDGQVIHSSGPLTYQHEQLPHCWRFEALLKSWLFMVPHEHIESWSGALPDVMLCRPTILFNWLERNGISPELVRLNRTPRPSDYEAALRSGFERLGLEPKNRTVLHVGAFDGREDGMYQNLGMQVFYVEPNPTTFAALTKRNPHRTCFNVALGESNNEVDFKLYHPPECSSMHPRSKEFAAVVPYVKEVGVAKVRMQRGDDLLPQTGKVAALMIDTQGHELQVLKGCKAMLRDVQVILTEIQHQPLYAGCSLSHEIGPWLAAHGFVKVWEAPGGSPVWGDALFIRPPTRL